MVSSYSITSLLTYLCLIIIVSCRTGATNRHYAEGSLSLQSTLKKTQQRKSTIQGVEDVTTVVFSFCDEQFPYRTKIPGTQVTLKQFKDYLPKKGNYRYGSL